MAFCDESKCVSKGRSNLHNDSFTCYGDDGTFYPMMCADGYLPLVVEDEIVFSFSDLEDEGGSSDAPLSYFTCCPPQHHAFLNSTDVARRCSDPMEAEWEDIDDMDNRCYDWDNRTQARKMKPNGMDSHTAMDSFLCCESDEYNNDDPVGEDSTIHNDATILTEDDFLEYLDCVPYRNRYYQASNAQNQIGATNSQNQVAMLRPISCDSPEHDFMVPRPFGNGTMDDVASTGRYQCCRSGLALPPFAPDSAFKITLYPAFVLFGIATVLSAIAGFALLLPLIIQMINGTYQKATNRPGQEPRYSTYNLYLVYLMGVDFVYCVFQTSLYGMTIRQKFIPGFHGFFIPPTVQNSLMLDPLVEQPYYFASLWLNCVISYEVLLLLKSTRGTVPQPSLLRVNLQMGVICIISLIIGSSGYFLEHAIQTAEINGNAETRQVLMIVFLVFGTLLGLPPILYTLNGACIIWWRGYIPSLSSGGATPTDRARRELGFFFMRIVLVYLAVWLPVIGLFLYVSITEEIWIYAVTNWLFAIQPILTFGMILTKPDARKYIVDLVTLSYLFGKKSCIHNCCRSRNDHETLPTLNNSINKKKAETRCRSTTNRTTCLHGSILDNSQTAGIRDKNKCSITAEEFNRSESGRYVYTSRRIPGRPAAILPTGELVSVTENIEIETPRTNTEISDDSLQY